MFVIYFFINFKSFQIKEFFCKSSNYSFLSFKVWVYKGDTLGRNDLPAAAEPRAEEERRPRGPRRDARPAGDRPARGARRPTGTNAAPTDGSDKPAEAADAPKTIVKRVRKVAAPTATGTAADGQGE